MSPGPFKVVGLKVFLSEGLSLRAVLGVLTNTRDDTPNEGRSSLTTGRNGKTMGDLLGVIIKCFLLSLFKYSTLVNETLPPQSPLCWLGQ